MKKKLIYVIGNNVNKSLSPIIFNHWFKKYQINAEYKKIKTNNKNFSNIIKKTLKKENVIGLNITIPFKEKIIHYLNSIDNHSKSIGAVNCITIKKNEYKGYNTDWLGYMGALKNAKIKPKQKNIMIIGYGGASKAILYFLLKENYKNIYVFNRTPKKNPFSKNKKIHFLLMNKIESYLKKSNLVINTIPINIFKKLKIKKIEKKIDISDIVYNPMETDFLKHFINPNKKSYGIFMLLYQAIPCFKLWFGFVPKVDSVLLKKLKVKNTK